MLMISGCAFVQKKATINACPNAMLISEYEQSVLKSELPEFYIRFTNQQIDLLEVNDEISR